MSTETNNDISFFFFWKKNCHLSSNGSSKTKQKTWHHLLQFILKIYLQKNLLINNEREVNLWYPIVHQMAFILSFLFVFVQSIFNLTRMMILAKIIDFSFAWTFSSWESDLKKIKTARKVNHTQFNQCFFQSSNSFIIIVMMMIKKQSSFFPFSQFFFCKRKNPFCFQNKQTKNEKKQCKEGKKTL